MITRTFALRHLFAATASIALFAPQIAQGQAQRYDLDIPSQDLDGALKTLASTTGQQVGFMGGVVRGKRSNAVKGRMTIEQAFATMLIGTGLAAKPVGGGAYVIGNESSDNVGNGVAQEGVDKEVVVTGSNIRGGNPESPVITLTRKDIERSGYSTAGDLIRNLPQSSGGGQNFNVRGSPNVTSNGNYSAISSANLRGLGSDATLTLVNGRRLAYGGLVNAVDVSSIPFGAIDRIEVLTDGASSIYGSDAVGGVVNFILVRQFEGALTTLNSGISNSGDGQEQQVNQLAGAAWKSGGILANYEYFKKSAILSTDRSFSAAAPSPNSLSPMQDKHSGFVSFHQNVSRTLTFGVDGIYTQRNSVNDASTTSSISRITAQERQYGVTPRIDWRVGSWSANLAVDLAGDRQNSDFAAVARSTRRASPSTLNLENKTQNYEAQASGPLFELPAGSVKVAVGGGFRSEELFYKQVVLPASATSFSGRRHITYGYGEVRIPLFSQENRVSGFESLELSASGRYEHYSDFGTNFSPKIGLSYKPISDLNLRATWARSFKAPTLFQYAGPRALTVFSAAAYVPGAVTGSVVAIEAGSNLDLNAEKATGVTVGFDYAPHWAPRLRVSGTYFHIAYHDRIATPIANILTAYNNPIYASYVLKNPTPAQYEAAVSAASTFNNVAGTFSPSQVVAVYSAQYQNLYKQDISGADLISSYNVDAGPVNLSAFVNLSLLCIRQQNLATLPEAVITGTIFNPAKFRARGGIQFQRGVFGGSFIANHVGPEVDNSRNFNVAAPAVNIPVSSMTTIDAQIVVGSTRKLDVLKGFQISFSVENALNQRPPSVALTSGPNFYTGFGYDTANHSPVGRFFRVAVAKRW